MHRARGRYRLPDGHKEARLRRQGGHFRKVERGRRLELRERPALRAMASSKGPLLRLRERRAVDMANRVAGFAHDTYLARRNYRGGPCTTGFWTMSNHVAFRQVHRALPSGRLAPRRSHRPHPEPNASKSLLDNIRDVARLDPHNMNNNIAFKREGGAGRLRHHERWSRTCTPTRRRTSTSRHADADERGYERYAPRRDGAP